MGKRKRRPTAWPMGFAPPAPPSRRLKHSDAPANATVQGTVMEVKNESPPGGLSALVSDFPAPPPRGD